MEEAAILEDVVVEVMVVTKTAGVMVVQLAYCILGYIVFST